MIQSMMIKKIQLELLYYFAIVVILAFLQHPDLLSSPLTRFDQMLNAQNYYHPFLWALSLYILISMFRALFRIVGYLKKKVVKK